MGSVQAPPHNNADQKILFFLKDKKNPKQKDIHDCFQWDKIHWIGIYTQLHKMDAIYSVNSARFYGIASF